MAESWSIVWAIPPTLAASALAIMGVITLAACSSEPKKHQRVLLGGVEDGELAVQVVNLWEIDVWTAPANVR